MVRKAINAFSVAGYINISVLLAEETMIGKK